MIKRITIKRVDKISIRFEKLQVIKALVLILIPFILKLKTGKWLSSISSYYYSSAHDDFVLLLTLAGLLYANDGILRNKWWNISIGASLIGVAYFPHLEYAVLHYLLAAYFFVGTCITMVVFSSKQQRKYKIIVAAIIITVMAAHFFTGIVSLLTAEWLCMFPMALHFIGESTGKID